LIFFSAQATK
jgi:hypothetical protein